MTFNKYFLQFFAFFFKASKGKREVERQVQQIVCKGIKLKINKTKNMNISFI